ncbi:MAG: HAD family hydrolase [Betaproteobacteria bacterium]|jgi:HAD superfamily hydrolase (TIGR01490 family)
MRLTLFDLDGTLLPTDSDHAFGEFMVRIGWADPQEHARRNDAFFQDYQAGRLDMHAYIDFATASWRDRPPEELQRMSERFMSEVITPHLREPARALVARHQRRGDRLAIVTATNDFITGPIAQAFGIDTLIATELERDAQGRVTGRILGTPCLREGKIERVGQWLAQQGTRLDAFEEVTFYGDSTNDLPLLEIVTHPVATNPAPALAKIAAARGWTVLNLFE